MRTLVITEHPEFGKVRTVEAGGRVWFCARDVASALGYANPKDAVNRHCRPKGVCVHDLLTAGGRQKVKFIDEGNLYRLMACSRLPSAERFESWIFDELVPRTLKEGGSARGGRLSAGKRGGNGRGTALADPATGGGQAERA